MGIRYSEIPVVEVLEFYQIRYEFGQETVKVECPWHGDKDPSCAINLESGKFRCFGCKKTGTIVDVLVKYTGKSLDTIVSELKKNYNVESEEKTFNAETIEHYHQELFEAKGHLKQLEDRGVTLDDIRKFRLGYESRTNRITIPIRNRNDEIVNVRKYDPLKQSRSKYVNSPGCGRMRLFPLDQLSYSAILLCGGELKAIAAIKQTNALGIGAITTTGGEGNWKDEFNAEFRDKHVTICFDIDEAGIKAAKKVARNLYAVAASVKILYLPLDKSKYPSGDLNNFIADGGQLDDVLPLAEEFIPSCNKSYDEDPEDIDFSELIHARYTKKKVRFQATVSSIGNTPYSLPKKITVECNQDQKFCSICPVVVMSQNEFDIHPENEALLSIVDARKATRRYAIQEATGIPTNCRMCEFEETEFHSMEKIRISQNLDVTSDGMQDKDYQIAIHNGEVGVNLSYEFVGRLYPHPETQSLTFLLSESRQLHNSLDNYKLEQPDQLDIFQPERWSVDSIRGKLNEIYQDFEANVTNIYKRRAMHLVVDLAYHSPLWAQEGMKGWAEVLIVGDTGQGKTQCAYRMRQFYKVGEFVSCNNTTFAGIVGGLKQYTGHKGWWIEWGVLPQNDKQLVMLEELKGLPVQAIGQLTDIRSSGIVKIEKIEKRSTHARTRLVCLSNPRDKTLSQYPYGCLCTIDLIGRQEDIRRFDFVYVVSKDVVPDIPELLANPPKTEHRFTSELCRNLILWAWTHNVKYEPEAESKILTAAREINDKYECSLEIITPGTTHEKLFRLSAALAARTFSHDDSYNILVRRCHVDFIVDFLMKHYDSAECDYRTFAEFSQRHSQVDENEMKKLFQQLGDAKPVIRQLLGMQRVDMISLQCLISTNRELASDFVRSLLIHNAIKRDQRDFKLTPGFIGILKKFERNGALDAPAYLKEEEEY